MKQLIILARANRMQNSIDRKVKKVALLLDSLVEDMPSKTPKSVEKPEKKVYKVAVKEKK